MKRTSSAVLLWTLVFAAAIAAVAAVGKGMQPEEWRSDDWAAIVISCLTGALFGVLAYVLQRRQSQLIDAVANGTLREKTGTIVTDSLRTLTGPVDLSLHVAREARAAMPLFQMASPQERDDLLAAILEGYGSLIVNSFPRSSALPLSSLDHLHKDGRALADDLRQGAEAYPPCLAVAQFVETGLDIEKAGRRIVHESLAPRGFPIGFDQVQLVYNVEELRVLHNWDADNMGDVDCSVEFHDDLEALAPYSAPWYIDEAGHCEVDFTGTVRADSCTLDDEDTRGLPRFPTPLTHAQVRTATNFRRRSIGKMQRILSESNSALGLSPSFAILAFQLATGHRLVLDGNHRLAAALRSDVEPDHPPLVYVFVIREGAHPSTSPSSRSEHGQTWHGFNPDVNRLRGSLASPQTA